MTSHFCQFITDFNMESNGDGDPIFCDKPAGMQIDGIWYCAEHFDEVSDFQDSTQDICRVCNCEFHEGGCNCE